MSNDGVLFYIFNADICKRVGRIFGEVVTGEKKSGPRCTIYIANDFGEGGVRSVGYSSD